MIRTRKHSVSLCGIIPPCRSIFLRIRLLGCLINQPTNRVQYSTTLRQQRSQLLLQSPSSTCVTHVCCWVPSSSQDFQARCRETRRVAKCPETQVRQDRYLSPVDKRGPDTRYQASAPDVWSKIRLITWTPCDLTCVFDESDLWGFKREKPNSKSQLFRL